MKPSARYAQGITAGEWQSDPAQLRVLQSLDRIHTALQTAPVRSSSLLGRLFGGGSAASSAVQGLYLYGGVGRGKTFLVDLLFDAVEGIPKRRTHFHRFMRELHARLRTHQGERDPLVPIAAELAATARLLVLDEFFVNDIGDAMVLGRLLDVLFAQGVTVVTTSNIEPDGLYKDGLQRAGFLPAIAALKSRCEVLHMDSATDYRLRALTQSPVYRAPLDAQSDAWIAGRFAELTHGHQASVTPLEINDREIAVRGVADGVARFDFAALCEGPRSPSDYIEIATEFHTVLVGGIPVFDGSNDDAGRRFVYLIDELYDRRINLVCTAAADPVSLCASAKLAMPFERTASRLIEMQSADYLASTPDA